MDNYSAPRKMKSIGDLFEKYRTRFKAPQATVEKACAKNIKEITGFTIEEKDIEYTVSTKTVSLNVPSVLKSEIKFHHEAILNKLQEELGRGSAPERII